MHEVCRNHNSWLLQSLEIKKSLDLYYPGIGNYSYRASLKYLHNTYSTGNSAQYYVTT